jgi:hypothetical protein
VNIDDMDDHPDLRELRLSKKDERAARAEWRRTRRQAAGASREPSFLRRHRTAIVSVAVLVLLVLAVIVLADRNRTGGPGTYPSYPAPDQRPGWTQSATP